MPSRSGYAAISGFSKSMSGSISAAEQRRLDGDAQKAQTLKAESLAATKANSAAAAADKLATSKTDAAKLVADAKVTAQDKDIKGATKVAQIKAGTSDSLSEEKAYELVYKDLGAQADPVEAKRRVDVLMGRAEPTPEETADPEGWFAKKTRQVKEVFGQEEAPTVAAPSINSPGQVAGAAPGALPPQIVLPRSSAAPAPAQPETAQLSGQSEAPAAALAMLDTDPSPENLAYFEETFGYIPPQYLN